MKKSGAEVERLPNKIEQISQSLSITFMQNIIHKKQTEPVLF